MEADLPDEHRAMLDFERTWTVASASKDEAVRVQFGFSPARYYQVLGSIIETEAALKYDPILVKRLLRMRDERRRARRSRLKPSTGS